MNRLPLIVIAGLLFVSTPCRAFEKSSEFGPMFTGQSQPALAGEADDAGRPWMIEPSAGGGSVSTPAEMLGKDYSAAARQEERAPKLVITPAEKLPWAIGRGKEKISE